MGVTSVPTTLSHDGPTPFAKLMKATTIYGDCVHHASRTPALKPLRTLDVDSQSEFS